MNNQVLVVFFLLLASILGAQSLEYCGTQGIDEEWEAYIREHQELILRNACEVYVPLTVHVLGDDNGSGYLSLPSIFGSLETLNKDFESTGIRFFLGGPLNYINNASWYNHSSFNVGSQMMLANNVENTINCYIVDNAAGACGYRAFTGDAIALAKSCTNINDHTWAHEVGHWLSLPHTFFGWEGTDYDDESPTPTTINNRPVEKVDGSNCTSAADRICDTPVDYLSFRWGCNDKNEYPDSLSDPNGVRFAVDGSLFMSYAFDNCQSRFSEGQSEEMCTYLQNWVPEVVSHEEPESAIESSQTKLIYPINSEVVENAVVLQWEEEGNASFYVVEISIFPNAAIPSLRQIVYGTSLDVFGLKSNKKYYWRVRSMNNYSFDYNMVSDIENFLTGELSSTEEFYAENLTVFPNPVAQDEVLNVRLSSQISEEIEIRLTNMEGKAFYKKNFFIGSGSNQLELKTSFLPSGIYILQGQGDLHNFQKKIVVE